MVEPISDATQSPEPRRPKRKRPFGVNAIIVLSALSATYGIGAALVLYFDATKLIPSLTNLQLARWLTIFFIGGSAVQLLVVIGLWQMKRWGWFLVMLNTGVGMFLNIWAYFYARPSYVTMVVSVLIVFYMNQREVQQAFVDTDAPAPPPGRDAQELSAI